ncbi:hypothetical protein FRAHR75_50099 [Frankia sp. Hr75.2]|nr:hypothetical protein FRAHR75_50099 [Frankia sp. Hr75.2]
MIASSRPPDSHVLWQRRGGHRPHTGVRLRAWHRHVCAPAHPAEFPATLPRGPMVTRRVIRKIR